MGILRRGKTGASPGDLTFPEFHALPPPHLILSGCPAAWQEGYPTVAEARQAEFYRVLNRLLDERALAKAAQISQYILQKELARDFSARGGVFTGRPPVQALTARQEFRAALSAVRDFAIGVASLAGERGIAINRVFSHFFTAKGAWAGMAWQFGSSKRGTPVFSGTFVSARPIERKDANGVWPTAISPKLVRIPFHWNLIETAPGVFDWTVLTGPLVAFLRVFR